ncbi:MAG: hypothetical protein ABI864_02010 [Chloroflexota bacterium]
MRRSLTFVRSMAIGATLGAGLALSLAAGTLATGNRADIGQPSAECGDKGAELEPHGFLTDGFAQAESVYAGSDGARSLLHAGIEHAVSQYDIASVHFTSSH